jgi:hypothetical protein
VSVAAGADIEALSLERAHRTLTVKRQGGKLVTIPLPQRTPGAIGLTCVRKSSPMTSTSWFFAQNWPFCIARVRKVAIDRQHIVGSIEHLASSLPRRSPIVTAPAASWSLRAETSNGQPQPR